jgi:hypothetical protein
VDELIEETYFEMLKKERKNEVDSVKFADIKSP